MSYITVDSDRIIKAYPKFVEWRKDYIQKQIDSKIDELIERREQHRKKWYGFWLKPMSREQAYEILNEGTFITEIDICKASFADTAEAFYRLYIAAKNAPKVNVNVIDFARIDHWL